MESLEERAEIQEKWSLKSFCIAACESMAGKKSSDL